MKVKVFVVDDNAGTVNLVKKYFNGGNEIEVVAEASDGMKAIKMLDSNLDFDIMLLDLIMQINAVIDICKLFCLKFICFPSLFLLFTTSIILDSKSVSSNGFNIK